MRRISLFIRWAGHVLLTISGLAMLYTVANANLLTIQTTWTLSILVFLIIPGLLCYALSWIIAGFSSPKT